MSGHKIPGNLGFQSLSFYLFVLAGSTISLEKEQNLIIR
jgi:acyl dehydratase